MANRKPKGAGKPNLPRIVLTAKNVEQKEVLRAISENTVTLVHGPAGVGKTHLAVASGLQDFSSGKYKKLIFTRPCVEAHGEQLGFLPGSFRDKIAPYMMPIYDIVHQYLDKKLVKELIENDFISVLPLAFQRGITFNDAFVVGDEFQNTIPPQIRMLLTRMGENSKVVLTGDLNQTDARRCDGLKDAIERLQGIDGLGIVEMTHKSVVRHPLVATIDKAYDK